MNGRQVGWALLALGAALAPGVRGENADLVAGGVRPELFLVYTGDVIGHLDPCG
jgi:hypothetical protein